MGNVRPDAACALSTEPDARTIATGYLDLAFDRPYWAHVLVENPGEDPVTVDGGWRNVWREPAHSEVISGRNDPARDGLVREPVRIGPGDRAIVDLDVLGAARVRFRRDYEEVIAAGGAPLDRDATTVVVLEGSSGSETIRSEPWTYGITVGLGRLVDAPAATDSAALPGQDCCVAVPSAGCWPGQDDERGSCSECAACWPEVCNFGQNPSCGGAPLAGCGS